MTTVYQPNRLNKTVPYTVFVAKVGTTTITAYQSGKVMFQGPQAEKEAARWEGTSTTPQKKVSAQTTTLPADFGNWSVIGSDEVGNGSYFGPVTVCAAYVDKSMISKLKALGVRDSKELTDPQIIQLSHVIKELIPKPEGILIDQFTPENNYRKYVRNEKNQVTEKLFFVTKGEQYHVAVAAASIISRAAFLEELDKESAELGFSVPSGAGSKSDQVAARILKKGGLDLLANYAKLHFANTQKAQKLL